MANSLYDKGREGFLDGSIDWDTDTIKAALVDLGAQKENIRAEMKDATAARDRKLAEITLDDKLAQFSPAELELLASRAQTVSGVGGIESQEGVGTPSE